MRKKRKKLWRSLICMIFAVLIVLQPIYPGLVMAAEEIRLSGRDVDFSRPDQIEQAAKPVKATTKTDLREPKLEEEEATPEGKLVSVDEYMKTY